MTGRSVRLGRWLSARGSLWLWPLAALLIAAVAVGDGSVGAQKVEPTDTTAAAGSDGVTRDHGNTQRPPNCSHGEVTLSNGTTKCRHCTRRTYYHDGKLYACRPHPGVPGR